MRRDRLLERTGARLAWSVALLAVALTSGSCGGDGEPEGTSTGGGAGGGAGGGGGGGRVEACASGCFFLEGSCGDGVKDPGELCDDGNTVSGDGCRADCLGLEECGDGRLDLGEACDDGNASEGDGCSALCAPTSCRNGVEDADEFCVRRPGITEGAEAILDVEAVDVNGDGHLDVLGLSPEKAVIDLYTGDGEGGLTRVLGIPVAAESESIVIGDLNDDGKLDVVAVSPDAGVLTVAFGAAAGTFAAPVLWSRPGVASVALGDVDGSGTDDLVMARRSYGLDLVLGRGELGLEEATATVSPNVPQAVALSDLDGDGDLDLVVQQLSWATSELGAYANDGAGRFAPASKRTVCLHTRIAVGDLDGANGPDIFLFGSRAEGDYAERVEIADLDCTGSPSLFDHDGDGDLDAFFSTFGLTGAIGHGDGTFGPAAAFSEIGRPTRAADLDGDGVLELLEGGVVIVAAP